MRFQNASGDLPHGLWDVLRWKLGTTPSVWPTWVDDPVQPPPPAPGTNEWVVTFINHATLLVQTPCGNVLTDPVFSQRTSPVSWAGPRRVRRPGLALEALPPIHGVLLSHNHYDHLDRASLRFLGARWHPWVVTPTGVGRHLRGLGLGPVHELGWWDDAELDRLRVTCTPAQHFSGRTPFDRNRTLWGGLHLASSSQSLFFAGDTGYSAHFAEIQDRLGAPDLALLPIGAYAPRWFMKPVHMDPAEAVQAHRDLGARASLGIHWGCFQLTDEELEEPLLDLARALAAAGVEPGAFQAWAHGESRRLARGALRVDRGYTEAVGQSAAVVSAAEESPDSAGQWAW